MTSIREIFGCIALSGLRPPGFKWAGEISIIKDLFGYRKAPKALSILGQVRLLQGKHIHLNLIRVGIENFTAQEEDEIDQAVQKMRDIYQTVQIGIGRVKRYYLTERQAEESGIYSSVLNDDASGLTDDWTVDNDAFDVFFVLLWDIFSGGTLGRSEVDGPCDKKDGLFSMTGSVVSLEGAPLTTGIVLAHEIGHYLGLDHINDLEADDFPGMDLSDIIAAFPTLVTNLMFPIATDVSQQLTSSQGSEMKEHCFIKSAC